MRTVLILIVAGVMTLVAKDGARAQSFTSLWFSNATANPVTGWLTLGANSAGKVQNVRLVDVSTGQVVPVNGVGLQGSFTLRARQTVSWNSFNGGVAAGAVTFRAPPQSCGTPGGPCGVTKGEFAINLGNEAVDVSSVDGINAIMAMDLAEGGATPWPANPNGGRVAQNSGTLPATRPPGACSRIAVRSARPSAMLRRRDATYLGRPNRATARKVPSPTRSRSSAN